MMRLAAWSILVILSLGGAVTSVAARPPEEERALTSREVRTALVGKLIMYTPAGTADMGVHEEFHPDGLWRGALYGRGPIPFSGRWSIERDQICVAADGGTPAKRWHPELYCRNVWQNRRTGELRMNYLPDQPAPSQKMGLQTLTVRDLIMVR
ncbi:hypothetical protein U1839_01645 [Sphingomonas sp. RT2P30]|uniref:hypothetical protein n=1 Tax=Parasphingomonas halimpatiens TaxID=3096162 RepID=UPI002FC9B49D